MPKNVEAGYAPVVLLEFLWWVDRRLAASQAVGEWETWKRRSINRGGLGLNVDLLEMMRCVMNHPMISNTFLSAFGQKGSDSLPTLESLISLELALAPERDFCGVETRRAFLELVILGSIADRSNATELEGHVGRPSDDDSAIAQRGGEMNSLRAVDAKGTSVSASDVLTVWARLSKILFTDPGLCSAAQRFLFRGS
ncbi:unnamed protein product, partial [Choristocarpus tenellus]